MNSLSYRRIIYFHNGSIGDFLMTLHLMENIHANDSEIRLVIVVPKYVEACRELAFGYPYVTVVHANRWKLVGLLRYLSGKNCCITPPTPGRLPLMTKLIARLFSMLPGERMIGFDDGSIVNKFLYTTMLTYNTSQLYFKTMQDVASTLGFEVKEPLPSFVFSREPVVFNKLKLEPYRYIVLHPFGSSVRRSILGEELQQLVKQISSVFDGAVVISGSEDDRKAYQSELEKLERIPSVLIAAGELFIHEVATLIESAKLYVGVDTGITHIAALLDTDSVVVAHGASTYTWLPYYSENAVILYSLRDSDVHEGEEYAKKHSGRDFEKPPLALVYKEISEKLHI